MSTNQQRLKSAIQRIARSDPQIRSLLQSAESRGDIPASGAKASSNADEDKVCCDGSVSDGGSSGGGGGSTVGTDTRFPDNGGQTGVDPSDPGNLDDMDGGSLDGMKDCATGQPVTFDGGDWIPPPGWDSPTELSPAGTPGAYLEGFFYIAYYTPDSSRTVVDCSTYSKTYWECDAKITDPDYSCIIDKRSSCAGTNCLSYRTDNPGAACDGTPPTHWPSDGTVHLAAKNGAIVGSKFDPENDGSYSKPKGEVSLCDPEGNQVNIKPAKERPGWKSISNGQEDGYMYTNMGKRVKRISKSEYDDPAI